MKLYRLCDKNEVYTIINDKSFENIGKKFKDNPKKNTHHYNNNKKYLHFFENKDSLIYLNLSSNKYICYYDIPDNIILEKRGFGLYLDYVHFRNIILVPEYAIENEFLKFEYLKKIEVAKCYIDFEDYLDDENLSDFVEPIYENTKSKVLVNTMKM